MMKSKELKTKIYSHADSQILYLPVVLIHPSAAPNNFTDLTDQHLGSLRSCLNTRACLLIV